MITAARLLERNVKSGYMMSTYTSVSGKVYRSGNGYLPPTWRVTNSRKELQELEEIKQFEIREFESEEELRCYVQEEMEEGARMGKPAVRAKIEGIIKPTGGAPKRDLSILRPPPVEEDDAVAPSPAPEPDSRDTEDNEPEDGDDGSGDSLSDSSATAQEPLAVTKARADLDDAIKRNLSASYITRMRNKLDKLLPTE